MKFVRIAALGLVLLGTIHAAAPPAAAEDSSPGECMAVDDASAGKLIETLHGEAIDPAAVGALMEPEVRYFSSDWGSLQGRDAVVAAFTDAKSTFDGLSQTAEEVLVDAPYVVVRNVLRARQVGEYAGIAPTGNETEVSAISVYRLNCGMIAEAWNFYDHLGQMAQMSDAYAAYQVEVAPSAEMDASCAPPTREDMETLVRAWFTDFFVNDPVMDPAEILNSDMVVHFTAGPDAVGIDAIEQSRDRWWAAFPDLRYRHGDIIVDGDLAAELFIAVGTDEGGFLGEEPTGKPVMLEGVVMQRVNCGRFVEQWGEADIAGAMKQLGVDGLK
ncbi:MAG: ester cyclase [Thermomicrobiales bacterium]